MSGSSLSLVNVFEIEVDGATRHVLCFLDRVLAGAKGLNPRAVIGEIAPAPDGSFDETSFTLNPEFVVSVTGYMNHEAGESAALAAQAASLASESLYVLDPRYRGRAGEAPPSEVLGAFAVDDSGQIAPGSFQYNHRHVWFEPTFGLSGLLGDRRFYDWLHPAPESPTGRSRSI